MPISHGPSHFIFHRLIDVSSTAVTNPEIHGFNQILDTMLNKQFSPDVALGETSSQYTKVKSVFFVPGLIASSSSVLIDHKSIDEQLCINHL